jgi:hypothetical protein
VEPPFLNSPGPSYAELFSRSAFSQRQFVKVDALRDAARLRDIALDQPARQQLVSLDRIGAFCPVAFSQANYDVETTWLDPDPEYMHWREERHFEPWKNHAWIAPVSKSLWVSEQYTPWQLLYLEDALTVDGEHMPPSDPAANPSDDPHAAQASIKQTALKTLDERWRPAIKLLVALQTRLWPYRKQRTTLLRREGDTQAEHVDPLDIEAARFVPRQVLEDFGLDLDGLALLHAEFAGAAMKLDPLPGWYRLSELAPRTQTDALRGSALRARDLHDASYLLRLLYHLATDRWLPRDDELGTSSIATDLRRRHLPRRAGQNQGATHDELQPALEKAGLYPHHIHFVVEGDTEAIVLEHLLKALGRTVGYQVTNLRGVDKTEQHAALFAAASQYATRTVLIADMEGGLASAIRRLQRGGLLTAEEDLLLWELDGHPSSFEEANFRPQEIADAIHAAARKRLPDIELDLGGEELASRFAEAVKDAEREKHDRPAFGTLALKLAEDRNVRVSKTELAHHLADHIMQLLDEAGSLYDAGAEDRPLLSRLWKWLAAPA